MKHQSYFHKALFTAGQNTITKQLVKNVMWIIEGHAFLFYCHRVIIVFYHFRGRIKSNQIWCLLKMLLNLALRANAHTNKSSMWVVVAADTTSKTRSKPETLSSNTWRNPELITWLCWPLAGQSGLADSRQARQTFWQVWLASLQYSVAIKAKCRTSFGRISIILFIWTKQKSHCQPLLKPSYSSPIWKHARFIQCRP